MFNLNLIIMPKNSVLQRPKVDVNTGRHDFDRSYVSNFNQAHGELRTVFLEPCVAGTKGVINARRFTRTAKVVFPAFQKVDQHIEFFKVPLRYLWSKWNDWKLNINDLNSTALVPYQSSPSSAPDLHMNVGCPRLNIGSSGGNDLITRMGLIVPADQVQVYKIMDDLNMAPQTFGSYGTAANSCMINLFGLAAYQKVYYDHFRNSTYESNNPYAYNLDWLQDNGGTSPENVLEPSDGTKNAWVTKQLFTLRYKNYRNDYFHNLYPSMNYSQSQPTGQDWSLPNNLQGVANLVNPGDLDSFLTDTDYNRWSHADGTDMDINTNVLTASTGKRLKDSTGGIQHYHEVNGSFQTLGRASINVQQIRAMFALDKLMRASAYAPKHVKEQYEARYGVKMTDKVSFESERLGSFINDVVFGEVTATSDTQQTSGGVTTGQTLGAIGGKGIGYGEFEKNDIPFYCEEDSIIIGIQYFLARANYDNLGVDEWHTKLTRNDFFIREYEHLGLRPMYHKFYAATGNNTSDNNILGFQEANMRYKVGIDRNHGLFNEHYIDYSGATPAQSQSELSRFAVHTNSSIYIGLSGGVDYRFFKAYPKDLDYIFELNYSATNMARDQFYGQTRFKFYVNAPMDVHSQPFL